MNALAEKMKDAGVDTIGARLTAACIEAIRERPVSAADAWHLVGTMFGHEFIQGLKNDMQGKASAHETKSIPTPLASPAPYKPRVIPQERLEGRRRLGQIVQSKFKNSGGIAWSDVGWHELTLLKRDGKEANALLEAGPASVPNDGRTVGDVLGIDRVDQIIKAARS